MTTTILGASKALAGQPSRLLTARGVAEMALQKIGAFSVNDTASDPEELARTLQWMDLILGERAGTNEAFWLRPATITQVLAATKQTYKLDEFSEYPALGIVYVTDAWLRLASGSDLPLQIYRRDEYEDIPIKNQTGQPAGIYIDRLAKDVTVQVHPVPTDGTLSLRLVVQTFNPSVAGDVNREKWTGETAHGLRPEFQLWLIHETAAQIADGPVRKLQGGEVDRIAQKAAASWTRIEGFANREKSGPRRTKAFAQ